MSTSKTPERLQKILARAGYSSRRKAEELIRDGLVTINGKIAQLGDTATWGEDAIKVDGKLIQWGQTGSDGVNLTYLFYKPRGVVSTLADPEGRPCLGDYLREARLKMRLLPVGRLDFNSEGLLLMTSDGALIDAFQKDRQIPRVYYVKAKGADRPEYFNMLKKGARVGERWVRPHSVSVVEHLESKVVYELVFIGGVGADLKGMLEIMHFRVEKMQRFAIGNLTSTGMRPGEFRQLEPEQVETLLNKPELGIKRLESERTKRAERFAKEAEREARRAEWAAKRAAGRGEGRATELTTSTAEEAEHRVVSARGTDGREIEPLRKSRGSRFGKGGAGRSAYGADGAPRDEAPKKFEGRGGWRTNNYQAGPIERDDKHAGADKFKSGRRDAWRGAPKSGGEGSDKWRKKGFFTPTSEAQSGDKPGARAEGKRGFGRAPGAQDRDSRADRSWGGKRRDDRARSGGFAPDGRPEFRSSDRPSSRPAGGGSRPARTRGPRR